MIAASVAFEDTRLATELMQVKIFWLEKIMCPCCMEIGNVSNSGEEMV
jgi:hypothetical protein